MNATEEECDPLAIGSPNSVASKASRVSKADKRAMKLVRVMFYSVDVVVVGHR